MRKLRKLRNAHLWLKYYQSQPTVGYFVFLRSVLQDVKRTVKAFQDENADPTKLLSELTHLVLATSKSVLKPSAKIDPLTQDISEFIDTRAYL